jgi:hypothetical protein
MASLGEYHLLTLNGDMAGHSLALVGTIATTLNKTGIRILTGVNNYEIEDYFCRFF